jgi:hypothetical protein
MDYDLVQLQMNGAGVAVVYEEYDQECNDRRSRVNTSCQVSE